MADTRPAAFIQGIGNTRFGRLEGADTLSLMSEAAEAALRDAGTTRPAIDAVVTGYSTAMPHLMLATLFSEHFGVKPHYCHGVQVGGATGAALVVLARMLVESGTAERVLVVAGENRLTAPGGREGAISTLAQVGHALHEVPYGATIPAYYALLASQYMAAYGVCEEDLAEFAVLMRDNAATHPDAHLTKPVTVPDVLASRTIATPLKLLDCCPISDGAVALVIGKEAGEGAVRIAGAGQAHQHQHISAATDVSDYGARNAAQRAFAQAGMKPDQMDILGIYDSFTITLCVLLEEIGFSGRGKAAADLRSGLYGRDGGLPLNPHGGLLSFGHSGVAGGLAHIAEIGRQLGGKAGDRQLPGKTRGFVHADGGVLSSHVSLVLQGE
jgi:acetyl-CoA C-acetyltransferase